MEGSGGAPSHTVSDSLEEGASQIRDDIINSINRRSTLTEIDDEDELLDIDAEDPGPSPSQPATLRTKNLDAGESVKFAENLPPSPCAPSPVCHPCYPAIVSSPEAMFGLGLRVERD